MTQMSRDWQRGASDMKQTIIALLQMQKAELPQGDRHHQMEQAIAAIVRLPVPTTGR